MTDLARSVTKRLMRLSGANDKTPRWAEFVMRCVGYSVYHVKCLDDQPSSSIGPVFPAGVSEVAKPQPLGGAKEIFTSDLPAVTPVVYEGIQGKPGSSIFRVKNSALIPRDTFDNLNQARLDHEHETCIQRGDQVALKLGKIKKIDKGICGFAQGDSNWYHWLAEVLPSVLLSRNMPPSFDDYPLLVPESALSIASFRDTLNLCRGDRDVVPLQGSQLYEIGKLAYIPPQVTGPFNVRDGQWPEPRNYRQNNTLLKSLRDTILRELKIKPNDGGPKRIFLTRPPGNRSYNQTDIVAAAIDRGFEPVSLERLSFREQVELMHNAEYVTGPTGAAFAHTLFMRPGSHILLWALREYAGACFFSNLAHVSNVNMTYCFVQTNSPILNSFEAFRAPYELPVEKFCHHIDSLLGNTA